MTRRPQHPAVEAILTRIDNAEAALENALQALRWARNELQGNRTPKEGA